MAKKLHEQIEVKDTSWMDMPLNTLEDYREFNKLARRNGVKVRIPPTHLHKHAKVKFQRFDQPENVLKFYRSNADIDFKAQLKPGHIYTLPMPIINFLNSLCEPIFGEVKNAEGMTETKQIGERNRFNCMIISEDSYG